MHIYDSRMTCEECGGTRHSGHNYPEIQVDVNYINNNTNYHPQNQGWNQQQRPSYSGNYQGNYQGNNFNNFNTPLRDLVTGQSRLLNQVSKKITSNDKLLETINNRMDSFVPAINIQHSFNKMIESQIAQLASSIPPTDKGKISG
jgi:hypothetical protein